ncbi:hypothetical protein BCF44_107257 [Kutzneria buriramensis]|uniref:DUF6924 domain-containing protein n=1 Tax=Kutzneria buriramensis TaxID=1045776 RepID=A0A3E0HI11_9PSEU|nr:hypothetical protein [Kutzneria buriramensis]REH46124.1 hypothetical protein BCF44_107257 [Kutzneria buriramensis]
MKPLPLGRVALVIRTDFSDQQTWDTIGAAIVQPTEEGFIAHVEFVDDSAYRGLTTKQLLDLLPEDDTSCPASTSRWTSTAPIRPVPIHPMRNGGVLMSLPWSYA